MANTSAPLYGGQALIEGVMIRARTAIAIALRTPRGDITRHRQELPGWAQGRLRAVPFVRGILILAESVVVGTRALNLATQVHYEEEQQQQAKHPNPVLERTMTVLTYLVVGVIAIGLFLVLPVVATSWIGDSGWLAVYANLAEGAIRTALILGYIAALGLLKDVRRMYAYHGAEHKTIAAAEAGVELTPHNIAPFPKAHPRCGTAFLLTVAILGVLLISFTPREPLWILITSRIVLIPLVMGIGYEVIRFISLHSANPVAAVFNAPNLLTQRLTTREPDDQMLEVAIAALQYARELDHSATPGGKTQ